MNNLVTLILLGLSVGLGNFAVSVAIGLSGVDKKVRTRVAIVFGVFETGMPIVGLIIGKQLASVFGDHANLIGGGLLLLTGIYEIISSLKHEDDREAEVATKNWNQLLLSGLALSIDNLIIGFSLGAYNEPIVLSAIVIGITSVVLALFGLEIGNRLSGKVGGYAEVFSGIVLVAVGLAVSFKLI